VFSWKNYDRPITINDKDIIKQSYPSISSSIIDEIYNRITYKNHPQPAVLIMILEMIYRDQIWDNWIYPVPISPFSWMDLETWERVQTPEMYAFHTVFESFALAQRNFDLMNQYIKKTFNKQILLFCDCGCWYIPSQDNTDILNIIDDINAFRSFYESIWTKVIKAESFNSTDRTSRTIDMWESEINSYKKMYWILSWLKYIKIDEPNDIYTTRQMLKKLIKKEHILA